VKAVLATSFERIHRTNLVCMGVLPLQFCDQTRAGLGLTGRELFDVQGLDDALKAGQMLSVVAVDPQTNQRTEFPVRCRIDTAVEIEYYRNGGVLPLMIRRMLSRR
jgi:aconitate hydratase